MTPAHFPNPGQSRSSSLSPDFRRLARSVASFTYSIWLRGQGSPPHSWRVRRTSGGEPPLYLPLNRRLLRRLSYLGIIKEQTSKVAPETRLALAFSRRGDRLDDFAFSGWLRWQELNLRKRLMKPLPGRWATPHWWRHRESNSDLPVAGWPCSRYHYAPVACSGGFEPPNSRLEDGCPSNRASSRWRGMKEFNLRFRFWRPVCWRNTYPSGDGCRSRTDLESFADSRLTARLTRHVFKEQSGGGERI